MEISQKAAEEEERYKKEMEKYTTSFCVFKKVHCVRVSVR